MKITQAILAFLVIGFVGQTVYYYPNLPEMMASHFNASGTADSWMPKNSFFIFEGVILLIILVHFFFLPRFIDKFPDSMINLPNKDYWLAAENRQETFSYIKNFFEWFFIGILGVFIAINELVFRANLTKQDLSNNVWIILVVFIIYVFTLLIKFIIRFKKTI